MSSSSIPVTLEILGKEYKILCPKEEQKELVYSAKQLDQQIREIRSTGKVSSAERAAILTALNLTHELAQIKQNHSPASSTQEKSINKMYFKIETALKSV